MKSPASPLIGRRLVVAGLVAVAVAVGLSACGSSSSGSTQTAASTGAQAAARLNLAKCFRAHGINVPDPSTGGGPAGGGNLFRSLRGYSQAQVTAARQACQQYFAAAFPRLNISPAQRAQLQQQLVKFAQCMRSHGVNVPDPTLNNNGGAGGAPGSGFGFGGGFRSGQRNSPAFQAAAKACQSLRPQFGRGGPGGAGGAGGTASGGGGTAGATGD
ncbi:MAG TPA: hypothetical protein VGF93_15270 [Solirubrobacteraceae bacterium]|jgi:hypothetical protein